MGQPQLTLGLWEAKGLLFVKGFVLHIDAISGSHQVISWNKTHLEAPCVIREQCWAAGGMQQGLDPALSISRAKHP